MSLARKASVPTLAAVFYLALILPPELSVTVGGLRLSPYRVVLLLVTVPLLLRLFQNSRQPPQVIDYLVMAHAAWVILALTVYGGVAAGLESGGIYAVETLGAYLVGRVAITSAAEHRAILYFMVGILAVMFLFTLPESVTGTHFIREAARGVIGCAPKCASSSPHLGISSLDRNCARRRCSSSGDSRCHQLAIASKPHRTRPATRNIARTKKAETTMAVTISMSPPNRRDHLRGAH